MKKDKGEDYTYTGKPRDEDRHKENQSFLDKLNLASFSPLERMNAKERGICPKCKAHRKFFCYDCQIALDGGVGIPRLKLPVDVTV